MKLVTFASLKKDLDEKHAANETQTSSTKDEQKPDLSKMSADDRTLEFVRNSK